MAAAHANSVRLNERYLIPAWSHQDQLHAVNFADPGAGGHRTVNYYVIPAHHAATNQFVPLVIQREFQAPAASGGLAGDARHILRRGQHEGGGFYVNLDADFRYGWLDAARQHPFLVYHFIPGTALVTQANILQGSFANLADREAIDYFNNSVGLPHGTGAQIRAVVAHAPAEGLQDLPH